MDNKTLHHILGRWDLPQEGRDVICFDDFHSYPAGTKKELISLGLIQEVEPATTVECFECEQGCFIEPVWHDLSTGRKAYYACQGNDEISGFFIEPERFRQWRFAMEQLAKLVAESIGAQGGVTVDVPDRVFFLGRINRGTDMREVFLAGGLTHNDAADVVGRASRLQAAVAPAVISTCQLPPSEFWQGLRPSVVSLAEIATVGEDGFKVDVTPLFCQEPVPGLQANVPEWLTVTEAAGLLIKDIPGLDIENAKARVSAAATRKAFRTNGQKGPKRRIQNDSFNSWRLKQRDRDLDKEDW